MLAVGCGERGDVRGAKVDWDGADYELDVSSTGAADSTVSLPCWVCKGTGRTSKWLSGFEVVKEDKSAEEYVCLVCYDEGKYGLSTECGHFYCEDCIKGSLEAMMDTAQFPAYCPQCRTDALPDLPTQGQILRPALTFLQQRQVITKEFEFR